MELKRICALTAGAILVGAAAIVVAAAAPVVSLVAVPIFALKAIPRAIQHRSLYKKTLTNGPREKFGRIQGQDYTQWDGKAAQIKTKPTWQDRMHAKMNQYPHGHPHGQKDDTFHNNPSQDCPFQTQEDLNWLKKEYKRREKKDLLKNDLDMLRAFSKALIPIGGIIWVLFTETNPGGASAIGCRVCMMGGDAEETHWGWAEALSFHQRILSTKLGIS